MVAAKYHLGTDDLWDEVITALLRVSLYAEPWEHTKKRVGFKGVHDSYGKTAIHRACWRYVVRKASKGPKLISLTHIDRREIRARHGDHWECAEQSNHDYFTPQDMASLHDEASAEEEVMAREAVYLRARQDEVPSPETSRAPRPARRLAAATVLSGR